MKKARILFLLCLVAALAIGMAVTASAAETTPVMIDYITITMELPYVGDPVDVEITDFTATAHGNGAALPEGTISMTLDYPYSGGVFGEYEHMLSCQITVSEGYQLAESVAVQINEDGNLCYITPAEGGMSYSGNDLTFWPRPVNYIHTSLPSLPVATAGAAIAPYSYTDPNGGYTLSGEWFVYDYATGTFSAATGNFESGKLYQLVLNSTAGEGYRFGDQELYVESEGCWYHQDESVSTDKNTTYYITIPCGEMERVEDVRITGLPAEITAGQTAGALTLTTESKVNLSAQWLDAEGNAFTGTFEAGKVYYLSVTVTPQSGAYLYERLWIYDEYYNHLGSNSTDGVSATVNVRYSLIPKVDKVEISGITDAVIGQAPTTEGIKVPDGAHYTLATESTSWALIGEGDGEEWTVFEDRNAYALQICVLLSEGYEWGEDLEVTANGVPVEDRYWYMGENGEGQPCIWISLQYSFLEIINKVDITGVTDAVIGQTPTLEGIQVSAGALVNVESGSSRWSDMTNGYWENVEGTFQDNHKYVLQLHLQPAQGYEFAEDLEITVNGQNIDDVDNWYGNGDSGYYFLNLEYSFVDVVKTMEITGVTDPAVGQTATTEGIACEVADVVATWYDEDGNEFTGTFETGKVYYLYLEPTLKEGYEIQGSLRVNVNGQRADEWYGEYGVTYYVRYSFKTVTTKVDITGVTGAVIGQTATVEGIQVSGAKLSVSGWIDYDNFEEEEPFTGTFADGGKYYLVVSFEANEGCEFSEDTVVTLNGVEVDEDNVGFYSDTEGQIFIEYSFKKQIDKVELTGMPQFAVGSTASTGSLKTPEGANYTVEAVWIGDNGEFTGTFTNEEAYSLYIMVTPKAGYEFADGVQILIDGKAADTNYKYAYDEQIELGYFYDASCTVLDKIEITVTESTIGTQISDKLITVPEDANYSAGGYWYVSEDGEDWEEADGVFEEGKFYRLELWFEIDDSDYMLANNGKIVINGTAVVVNGENGYIRPEYGNLLLEYDALCAHTYGDWTSVDGNTHSKTCTKCGDVVTAGHEWHSEGDVKCPACGYDRSDNPPTGDAFASACLLVLCSVTALVVIRKRRSVR